MIRYAALASGGSKARGDDRDSVDAWARDKCAAGRDVDIYATAILRTSANGSGSELVGRWEAL